MSTTMRVTDPCGCKHDGRKWLHFCDQHNAEVTALHAQAAADHAQAYASAGEAALRTGLGAVRLAVVDGELTATAVDVRAPT